MTIFLLKCKCGNKHYLMSRDKPILLSENHSIYKRQRKVTKFKENTVREFVKLWNKANPEDELIIEEKSKKDKKRLKE